jgi:hypothetical protein
MMELLVRVLGCAGAEVIGPSAGCGVSEFWASAGLTAKASRKEQAVSRMPSDITRDPPENDLQVLDECKGYQATIPLLSEKKPFARSVIIEGGFPVEM